MKKVMTGLILILLLIGCSSKTTENGENSEGSEVQQNNEPIELKFWTMRTNENMVSNLQKQIDEFEEENPHITVELEPITYDVAYQRMLTAEKSGDIPNVFNNIEAMVAFLHAKGAIVPVNDVIDDLGGTDEFMEKYLDWVSSDDSIYDVPDWGLHQGIWYRKDLFEEKGIEIPRSWEELAEAAKKLTIDENGDGKIDVYGMVIPLALNMVAQQTYSQFLYSADVNIFDPETGEYAFGENKDKAIEA